MKTNVTVATGRNEIKKIILSYPMLTAERETELFARWRKTQDQEAFETIVYSFARIVQKYANMATRGSKNASAWMDIFQAGVEGIMTAIPRFDETRNTRFSTFVTFYIRWKIQDYLQRNGTILSGNMGTRLRNLQKQYPRIKREAESADLGAETVEAYVARRLGEEFGYSIEEIERYRVLVSSQANLEDTVGEDGKIGDVVADEGVEDSDEIIERMDRERRLEAMRLGIQTVLTPRERTVLARRRLSAQPETLQDIADDMKLSKERVRQIEASGMTKLKGFIDDYIERSRVERSEMRAVA